MKNIIVNDTDDHSTFIENFKSTLLTRKKKLLYCNCDCPGHDQKTLESYVNKHLAELNKEFKKQNESTNKHYINNLQSGNDCKDQCPICKDTLDHYTYLRCGHKFHKNCIIPWLGISKYCPLCRYTLPCGGHKMDDDIEMDILIPFHKCKIPVILKNILRNNTYTSVFCLKIKKTNDPR